MAHADLAQLDAGMILPDQILDQLPKIYAGRRGKVENEFAAIKQTFHIYQLHVQLTVHDAASAEFPCFAAELFIFSGTGKLFRRGGACNQKLASTYGVDIGLPLLFGFSGFFAPVVGFQPCLDAVATFQSPGGGRIVQRLFFKRLFIRRGGCRSCRVLFLNGGFRLIGGWNGVDSGGIGGKGLQLCLRQTYIGALPDDAAEGRALFAAHHDTPSRGKCRSFLGVVKACLNLAMLTESYAKYLFHKIYL